MGEDPGGTPRRWPWVVALCLIVASAAGAVLVVVNQSGSEDVTSEPTNQSEQASVDTVFDELGTTVRTTPGFNEWTWSTKDIEIDGRSGRSGAVGSDDSTSLLLTLLDADGDRPAVLRLDYVNGT